MSVVESVSAGHSSPRSVVTSPSGNVTIGFNFKVSADSGDAGSATKSGVATQNVDNNATVFAGTLNNVVSVARETPSSCESVAKIEDRRDTEKADMAVESRERDVETRSGADENVVVPCKHRPDDRVIKIQEEARLTRDEVETESGRSEDVAATREDSRNETASRGNVGMDLKSVTTVCGDTETTGDRRAVYKSTKELQVPAYPSEDTASARISVDENNRALSSATKTSLDDTATESLAKPASEVFSGEILESSMDLGTPSSIHTANSQPQERASTSVQKHKSSLEKLLSLFQNPSSLFSDSSSAAVDTRTSLQENMSGVMALGDKLQQYLKEGRAKVSTDSSSWSSEHGSPSRNRSIRLNVSQLQSLTGIFTSFKLDPHASLVEHSARFFGQTKNQAANINERDPQRAAEVEVAGNDEKNFISQKKGQVAKNDERNFVAQENSPIIRNDEENCACCEQNLQAVSNEKDLIDYTEENQVAKEDEQDLFSRDENRVTRNDESNSVDQEKNQITRNAESNLFNQEQSQITRDDGEDLFGQEKSQVARDDEQKSLDRVTRNDEENVVNREKKQVSDDENNLFEQLEDQVSRSNEKDLEESKEMRVVDNMEEDFQEQDKDQVVTNSEDKRDLNKREEVSPSNSKELEDRGKDEVANSNGQDSAGPRDVIVARVIVEGDSCSVCELQWTAASDDRPLPESVQSKEDVADKDLVLESGCVATSNATASSSPTSSSSLSSSSLFSLSSSPASASKFTACVAVKLTDIPEYSVLELSQADGMVRDDAKCSVRRDDGVEDDEQDPECAERDDAVERSARVDSRRGVEHDGGEVSGSNSAKCSGRGDEVTAGGACAATEARTCDTTTTDSINQTSDSSFPICNIARNRKVVDSLSAAGAPTTSTAANDVDGTTSAPGGDGGTPSTSSRDADAGDFDLNDQVTSGTRRVAGEDHWCNYTRRKGEEEEQQEQQLDPAEVLDDACRGSAHCSSTSVNIKLESCESTTTMTTNPVAASRDASERLLERQSSMPNNVDVHRNILKDAAEAEDPSEDAVDDTESQWNDPTILVTPYEEACANLDKSDADELIFCITDISTDGTSVEDELSPSVPSRCSPNDVSKVTDSYFELPLTTTLSTATTLLIGHPEDVHRNSQDSGIDEAAMTIDDSVAGDAHPLPPTRGSLQESVDSGIESECSLICIRVESAAEQALGVVVSSKRSPREDGGVGDDEDDDDGDDGDDGGGGGSDDGDVNFGKFASDFLPKEVRLVDNDSVSGIACSYLSSIKCAVVSAARPVAGMASSGALGVVIADEGVARPSAAPVIAHSPATVHGTR